MARQVTRSASRKKQNAAASRNNREMWADNRVTENPEAPAAQREASQQRLRVRLVKAAVYGGLPLALVLGVVAYNATASAGERTIDLRSKSMTVNDTRGKAEAFSTLEQWLTSVPSPLPGAKIVSWDGFTNEPAPILESDQEDQQKHYAYEQHSFTVQRDASMFKATVEVAVDDIFGAVSTSTPSLKPITPVSSVDGVTEWFGMEATSLSESARQSIQAWAEAFTSGVPSQLHQVVQDQVPDRTYVPLTGVDELMEVNTTASAVATPEAIEAGATEDAVIARVELKLWWLGGRPVVDEFEQETLPEPITYDILINHASTATPVVVAWGAPGSGPDLTPHSNAVDVVLSENSLDPGPQEPTDPVETEVPRDGEEG